MFQYARSLIRESGKSLLVAALGVVGATATAAADTTLRLAVYPSPNHVYFKEAWLPFSKEVEEQTGGAIKFNIFHSEQLGKAADSVRMAQTRIADIVFLALPYHGQEMPASQAVNLPLGWDEWTAASTFWRAIHEPGVIHDEWKRVGLVPLMIFSNPSYEFHSTTIPLPGLSSLKGTKMRSPGDLYGPVLKSLGVVPIEVKSTEQYEALQRGLINTSIYTFSSWKNFSVDEVLKHTTLGNKVITVTGLALATTPRVLNSLSPEHRKVMLDVGRKYMTIGQEAVLGEDKQALDDFVKRGLKTYEWSAEDKKALQTTLEPVVKEWADKARSKGIDGARVLREIAAFRAEAEKQPKSVPAYTSAGPSN